MPRPARRLSGLIAAGRALRDVVPQGLLSLDSEAWLPEVELGHAGIELHEGEQLARLQRFGESIGGVLGELRRDRAINTLFPGEPFLHNGQYPTPDAEVYAGMIAERRPETIVEVGGGFSTLIARRAVDALRLETRIVVIDPEPWADVAPAADELRRTPVESLRPDELPVGPEDLLFIDSSHVVRTGGDVPYLFNRVIPALPVGAVVHVHDVFIPWDYPQAYRARLYGEQYVLQALLSGAPRYRTQFATHWMTRRHGDAMRAVLGPGCGRDERFYGGSYWFAVTEPG